MMPLLRAAAKLLRISGRIIIFLILVILTLNNSHDVGFQLIPGITWNLPLILLLFIAFICGILVTLVGQLLRRRPKQIQ